MSLTLISILAAISIFVLYNALAILFFNVPHSLSMTYYLYKDRWNIGWVFPVTMMVIVGLLLPSWLTISNGSTFQFLSFLAPASLAFVAASPAFLKGGMENTVHTFAAYFAAACSILWVVLVTPYWYNIAFWVVICVVLALLTKTIKTSHIYWLEMIAFGGTFASIYEWAKLLN
jgi:hypothetical protein